MTTTDTIGPIYRGDTFRIQVEDPDGGSLAGKIIT